MFDLVFWLILATALLVVACGALTAAVVDARDKLATIGENRDWWRSNAREAREQLKLKDEAIDRQAQAIAALKAAAKQLEGERAQLRADLATTDGQLISAIGSLARYEAMPRASGKRLLTSVESAMHAAQDARNLIDDAIRNATKSRA